MALASNTFEEGATALVAQTYAISAKLPFNVTADEYTFICNTSVEETFNEEIITKYTLCGEGAASNTPGGQDYEVPFEVAQTKGDTELSQWAYRAKHNQNARVNIPIRIDNTLMNTRTEFIGVFILDSAGGAAEEEAIISGTIKPYVGAITTSRIDDETTPPTTTPATATATADTITDTTATINYDVTLNDDTSVVISVNGVEETVTATGTGSFDVTGLTAETAYDITMTSALNTTPITIGNFTTIASGV